MTQIHLKPYIDHGLEIIDGKEFYVGELWTGHKLLVCAKECRLTDSPANYRFAEDMAQIRRLGLEEEFRKRFKMWEQQQ